MDESGQPGLTAILDRVRSGDPAARDHLFRTAQGRLEQLARRILRRHPAVRRWAETGDVLPNASVRLLRALEGTPVADTRKFSNLATAVIRRGLSDMARHLTGSHGPGRQQAGGDGRPEPAAPDADTGELDRWTALHEAVGRLPTAGREVFGLTLYHGWTQRGIAVGFGVDERTVRRRWRRPSRPCTRLWAGRFRRTEGR